MNSKFRRNYIYKLIDSGKALRYSGYLKSTKEYVFHSGAYKSTQSKEVKIHRFFIEAFSKMIFKDRWCGDPEGVRPFKLMPYKFK